MFCKDDLSIYLNTQYTDKYIKKRCGMIANETNLHKRPNDTEII